MRKTIETIMRQTAASEGHRSLALLLKGVSVAYGWGQRLHRLSTQFNALRKRLGCIVVSVGNLTTGGTGKTPMVIYLARLLQENCLTVTVLSRGYGGQAESQGGLVSDGQRLLMTVESAGDEPVLLAGQLPGVPVVVGRNRFHSGLLALEKFQPDVILLDDGFQHYGLQRDVDVVLLDGRRPLGNGYLLPRGTLREPLAGLERADALIMTRAEQFNASQWGRIRSRFSAKPLFRATHQPNIVSVSSRLNRTGIETLADLKGASVLAFSGIGQNETFFHMIETAGARLVSRIPFPDHFAYGSEQLRQIERQADLYRVDYILTTAKDAVRLPDSWEGSRPVIILDVKIAFDSAAFDQFIVAKIESVGT